ncbi:VOC family protein [Methanoculleus sp. FWC-SCC3]|uniref:VOC family protein n=1 Tax=Methanoculleus methanifontis TaxID=2584086 RepID=A0ABT8M391_9EURY|nr:VOC family protein [Methanoculleus sp. FWC-SCC3]MDN7012411.1 VOC family protein [Methanoculleus sp. FWC-SCC3]
MPTITWFNIPAAETERARAFYEAAFAWEIEPFPGMESAFLVTTGGVDGEIFPRARPDETVTVFIGVPSIDEYVARIKRAGGEVVVSKTPVPGRGYFAIFRDTERNQLGLWEDDSGVG